MPHRRRPSLAAFEFVIVSAMLVVAACGRATPTVVVPPTAAPTQAATTAPVEAGPTALPENVAEADSDEDGALDAADNCPAQFNPTQYDLDADGGGGACDVDLDGDGLENIADACPFVAAETCAGGMPRVIELYEAASLATTTGAVLPATGRRAAPARQLDGVPPAAVTLTYFPSDNPAVPDMLSGVVRGGSDPLWTEAGGLTFRLGAVPLNQPIPWEGGGPGFAFQSGEIAIHCPPDWGGACSGTLDLTPACNDPLCGGPPNCSTDARCDWATTSVRFPGAPVWAAFDPAGNTVRFSTGLPVEVFGGGATRYDVFWTNGAETTRFFGGGYALDFPLTVVDATPGCVGREVCPPAMDILDGRIEVASCGEVPELRVTLQMAGDLAGSGVGQGIQFITQNEAGDYGNRAYLWAQYPNGVTRQFTYYKPWGAEAPGQPEFVDHVTLIVDGAQVTYEFPLVLNGERVMALQSAGAYVRTPDLYTEDSLRDYPQPDVAPVPLLYAAWPTGSGGIPPVLIAGQFKQLASSARPFAATPCEAALPGAAPDAPDVQQYCPQPSEGLAFLLSRVFDDNPMVFHEGDACREREIVYDGETFRLFDPLFEGQPETPSIPPGELPVLAAPVEQTTPLPVGDLAVTSLSVAYALGLDSPGIEINGLYVGSKPVFTVIKVKNNGPTAVSRSALFVSWDANAEYGAQGRDAEQEHIVGGPQGGENLEKLGVPGLFALPPLAPGEEITLGFETPVITLANRTLRVSVVSNEILELNQANNVAQANGIAGIPAAAPDAPPPRTELSARLIVPSDPVQPGQEITVTIRVSNTGQTPLTGVTLGLTTNTSSGVAGWIYGDPTGVRVVDNHTIGAGPFDLAPGQEMEFVVPITAQTNKPVKLTVTAVAPDEVELRVYRSGVLPVQVQ